MKLKNLRKNKKGFTLVEIIVVLVILAILAAAAIPTMLGFVDDAKKKTEIANARAAYVAAQTIATETYATSTATSATDKDAACVTAITKAKVESLASLTCTSVTATVSGGKVTSLVFVNNGKTVTITPGGDASVS